MQHSNLFTGVVLILSLLCLSSSPMFGQSERQIEVANSPMRVTLQGNTTYRVNLNGISREFSQRKNIRLRYLTFDPLISNPEDSMLEALKARTSDLEPSPFIVQFVTQAFAAYQREIVRIGGKISVHQPDHAVIAHLTSSQRGQVEALSFVRWVGAYHPAYKLEPGLENASATPTSYSMWLFEKGDRAQEAVERGVQGLGGTVTLRTAGSRMEATLTQRQLFEVAQLPGIAYIDLRTPIETDMDIVRALSGANFLESVQGYTGQGVRGEVLDSGLFLSHENFQANPPIFHPSNDPDVSHGTSVFSIVFGSGQFNSQARGLLPDADQPIMGSFHNLPNRYAHTGELVDPGGPYRAVFQTNSWGNARTLNYTTVSADMDELLFDHDILITQSQSNAGNQMSRPQAWAKNIVSVGGVRHFDTLTRNDDAWSFGASIGPAADGRIKPDLWHFYDATRAASSSGVSAYTNFGGTSGATPIVAGHAGLVFQMWADGVFAGNPGQNLNVFDSRPHMTTAKALLINSAFQYSFNGIGHDKTRVHQGWGMPDVQKLYETAEAHNWILPILIDETAVITPLETHTYTVNSDGSKPLLVTMVYADPPGNPAASVHRINDLTLKVTDPVSTVYWGNNGLLSGNWSSAGGSSNILDTVENVFIENPASGTWTVEVLGDEIVQDGHVETPALDADYALVATFPPLGEVIITVTPQPGDPVLVGPQGTSTFFTYDVTVDNNGTSTLNADIWNGIILPVGEEIGPVQFPTPGQQTFQSISVPASGSFSQTYTFEFPPAPAPGTYVFNMKVGTFANVPLDRDTFSMIRSSGPSLAKSGTGGIEDWLPGTVLAEAVVPEEFVLEQNYPNPFNPSTRIRYGLTEDTHVKLSIYNTLGQEVVTLVDELQSAGFQTVIWNGRNNSDQAVSAGIYLYKIEAGNNIQVKKMAFTK